MSFGSNFLNNNPTRWTTTRASMTTERISLEANGIAKTNVLESELSMLPEMLRIFLICDRYWDSYNPKAYVEISVEQEDRTIYKTTTPIIATHGNVLYATVPFNPGLYRSFEFAIITEEPLIVYRWELHAILVDVDVDLEELYRKVVAQIPQLVWNYNTEPIVVRQAEVEIGRIEVETTSHDKARGTLHINFMSNIDSEVTLRIYNENTQQLYSPIIYQATVGYNEIEYSHIYLHLAVGLQELNITMQTREGQITIPTRAFMYAIDLVAIELVDVPFSIYDVSVRQPEGAKDIDFVFIIAMDGRGWPIIAYATYKKGLVIRGYMFTVLFGLPTIRTRDLAIEFDGVFQRLSLEDKLTLVTEVRPWIFWVDWDYNLWGQWGEEEGTRIHLASQVLSVTTCRGWNSIEYPEQDAGLIIAYVKMNGRIAYRYLLGTVQLQKRWEVEQILLEAGDKNNYVHVHRLNDYRIGFTVTHTEEKHRLFITNRYWVQDAVPVERTTLNNFLPTYVACGMIHINDIEEESYPITFRLYISEDLTNLYVFATDGYLFWLRKNLLESNFNRIIKYANFEIVSISNKTNPLHIKLDRPVSTNSVLELHTHPRYFVCIHPNGSIIPVPPQIWLFTKPHFQPSENTAIGPFTLVTDGTNRFNMSIQPVFEKPHFQPSENTAIGPFTLVTDGTNRFNMSIHFTKVEPI